MSPLQDLEVRSSSKEICNRRITTPMSCSAGPKRAIELRCKFGGDGILDAAFCNRTKLIHGVSSAGYKEPHKRYIRSETDKAPSVTERCSCDDDPLPVGADTIILIAAL